MIGMGGIAGLPAAASRPTVELDSRGADIDGAGVTEGTGSGRTAGASFSLGPSILAD
jgi:hypothetical protein